MKKILFILCMILLVIPLVSAAWEWDNVKSYDKESKKVTIINAFNLPLIGNDLATITLNTPQHFYVIRGEDRKVAEFTINNYKDYKKVFNKLEFFNTKKDMKKFDREFTYKYKKSLGLFDVNDYETICEDKTSFNGTKYQECYKKLIGTHQEERFEWVELDTSKGLPEGEITIGIFTDVYANEKIEWIPTLFGVKIKEFAIWEEYMDTGLTHYYNFDEEDTSGSGTILDKTGTTDGTNVGAANATGKIKYAYDFINTSAYIDLGFLDFLNQNVYSISFWVYLNNLGGGNLFSETNTTSDTPLRQISYTGATGEIYVFFRADDSDIILNAKTGNLNAEQWYHFVFVDDNGGYTLFLNGTNVTAGSYSRENITTTTTDIGALARIPTAAGCNATIDELGLWVGVALNESEVSDLWNNGDGITFIVLPPSEVTLNTPANDDNFYIPTIDFNCSASDDSGITNVSLLINGTIKQTNSSGYNGIWYGFTETITTGVGFYNWTCQAYDDDDQLTIVGSRNFTYSSDINITLNDPADDFSSTVTNIAFNGTGADDTNLANISLIINGVYNGTNSSVFNNTLTTFLRILPQGVYNWTMEACDDLGNCINAINRSLEIHTTPSILNLDTPRGIISSFILGDNLTVNWSVLEPGVNLSEHIIECLINYNGVVFNVTNVCITTNSTSNITYVQNINNLTMNVTEEFGFVTANFTSWSFNFLEAETDITSFVNETSEQDFTLNLSTAINILSISAFLNYNETVFDISTVTCDGGDCTLENTIDIPLVTAGENENKSFFWEISIFNGTDSLQINTTSRDQNVTRIHLEACNGTYTDTSLNFTAYDEQTLAQLATYNFNGTFEYWIGGGTVRRSNSFINTSQEFMTCILPNAEMKTDAIINYDQNGTSGYTSRFYYLDDFVLDSNLQNISLYLLNTSTSTSFILKVQDESLLPVSEAIIEIHRFYPGEGIFRIVQIARTDDNGKSIGFFETETIDYKFIIKKDGETLLETGQQKVIPETSPFTLTFNIGDPLGEVWSSQQELDDLNSSLIWNDTSGMVTYVYIDSSDNFTLARLLVIKQSLTNSSNDTTICNTNLSIASGTLTCNVSATDGFYIASAFITRNSFESLDKQFMFQIETLSSVVGLLGLFFGWFLILIASFMFKFNEIAGIWAITVTVFLINLTGLINFGGVFVTAVIALAIILTWVMEK